MSCVREVASARQRPLAFPHTNRSDEWSLMRRRKENKSETLHLGNLVTRASTRNAARSIPLRFVLLRIGVCRGPSRVLERLPEALARLVSDLAIPGDVRTGEDQLPSVQQEDRQSHQIPQG